MPNFPRFRKRPNLAPKETSLADLDGADLEIWGITASHMMFAIKVTGLPQGDALLWSNNTGDIKLPVQMKRVQIRLISNAARRPHTYQITSEEGVFSLVCNELAWEWEADGEKSVLWRFSESKAGLWDEIKAEAEKEEA